MANTCGTVSPHNIVKIRGFHANNNFGKNNDFLTSTAI